MLYLIQPLGLATQPHPALQRHAHVDPAPHLDARRSGEWPLSAAVLVLGLCACTGESNSVLPGESMTPPAGSGGSAASSPPATSGAPQVPSSAGANNPPAVAGSNGSEARGGANGVATGTGASTATAGAGGSSTPPSACQPRSSVTIGVRMTFPVSWPATLGTTAGSGDFELLNVYRLAVNGNAVTGTVSPCGSALPPLTFSGLIGGGNSLIEIPDSVWETPGFPTFDSTGTLGGWTAGSTVEIPASGALVGLTMTDPTAPWPSSSADVDAVDPDADGNPGITAIPATGNGLTSPPVSIIGPRVDQVDIVSRTAGGLTGAFTSCTELAGTAALEFFDNHVVGCRTVNGAACNASQTDFVDSNRTIYEASPGTFKASILAEGATCADARAAVP